MLGHSNEDDYENTISIDEAKDMHGVVCAHERMDNGELRFRLRSPDGSAYIRTVAGTIGAWQKSHFHKTVRETYIVQDGWMAMATLRQKKPVIQRFAAGGIVTTKPFEHHNVYLPAHAVIHTVKHGNGEGNDWWKSLELDELIKNVSEQEIIRISMSPSP